MARPIVGDEKFIPVTITMEPKIKEMLCKEAKENYRTVSAHIRWILDQHFKNREGV
tara:strand:- start:29990 stop:30157 length:168 start_codon:yes stop_codon:yes gene_type:complete